MSRANGGEALRLENIHHGFDQGGRRLEVLKGAELGLKSGQITALLGVSGSGKSTLLGIGGLLENPEGGRVLIGGEEAKSEGRKTELRRRHIGFVHQFHHLLADLSAEENLALPLMIQGKSGYRRRAKRALAELGLADRAKHLPTALSGGECQRLAVARALVGKPKVILADEPTGNLDRANAELVFAELAERVKRQNVAALVATHDKDLSARCDEVLEIREGRLKRL